MRVDFCIPIKNEAATIEKNILSLISYIYNNKLKLDWKIIGAVNNSSDESLVILKELKEKYPDRIDYLDCPVKGKGAAIKNCWRQSSADVIAFMDADLAVSLDSMPHLLDPIISNEADLVISSRFMKNSSVERSLKRGIMSAGYIYLSKLLLHHNYRDLQCGFKLIKKSSFDLIDKFLIDDKWFFDTELVVISEIANLRIVEVPVKWTENRVGNKKSNIKVFHDSYCFLKQLIVFKARLKNIKKYFYNV